MEQIYSVSQINSYIKSLIAREYALNDVIVKGEISNCKYHSSGHIYFTLKDNMGKIACVMFAGNSKSLNFRLADGMSVLASGSIGVYERDGRYQLYVTKMYRDGVGLLYEKLEMLKEKLSKEGLFSDVYKKPIPRYAKTVGIVTASTGAAIQDIINISTRRNPYVQLILYPVHVQGDEAAPEIAHAIKELDKINTDVIIVGRGGGSFEDLFAFNEEIVVRAIFECKTPVVSAVGHEVDTTLSDYVADMRAPTPSAAAELCVYEIQNLFDVIYDYDIALNNAINRKIEYARNSIRLYETRLKSLRPDMIIKQKRAMLISLCERLNLLSPLNRLTGGYAYVTDKDGIPLKSVHGTHSGDSLKISLSDGYISATVDKVTER